MSNKAESNAKTQNAEPNKFSAVEYNIRKSTKSKIEKKANKQKHANESERFLSFMQRNTMQKTAAVIETGETFAAELKLEA